MRGKRVANLYIIYPHPRSSERLLDGRVRESYDITDVKTRGPGDYPLSAYFKAHTASGLLECRDRLSKAER